MQPRFLTVLMCIMSLLFQACKEHPENPPEIPQCQIIQIRQGISDEDSLAFVYNNKGNPVSITRAVVGTTRPNFHFQYDKKGRMTDFYGDYISPNPYFDVWHRYKYDGQNRISTDTTYEFGLVGPGIPLPDNTHPGLLRVRNISTYKYDWKNRMLESTDTYGYETRITVRSYTYNQEGNVSKLFTRSGTDTSTIFYHYDDQFNFRRLHPIWQFLDRDYSLNNKMPLASSITFNEFGLPSVMALSGNFATIPLDNIVIRYKCR